MIPSRSLLILALFFLAAGANHFLHPAAYVAIMPPFLPWPGPLVAISGAAEMLGGLGILIPRVRGAAAWGLIALLVAVFPANVHMAWHGVPGAHVAPWILWARLPLQLPLIWWVWRECLAKHRRN